MAKFQLKFLDEIDPSQTTEIEKKTFQGKQHINIIVKYDEETKSHFSMDKSTAILFAKTLRSEINKLIEREVANG